MKQAAVVGGYNCMLFTKKKLKAERKQKRHNHQTHRQTDTERERAKHDQIQPNSTNSLIVCVKRITFYEIL